MLIALNTACGMTGAFFKGLFCSDKAASTEEKQMRENLSEKQIDKMLMDSFPASDPPSTY